MEAVTALLLLLCCGLGSAQEDDDMMQNKVSETPPPLLLMVDNIAVRETAVWRVVQQPGPPQLGHRGQSPGEEDPSLLCWRCLHDEWRRQVWSHCLTVKILWSLNNVSFGSRPSPRDLSQAFMKGADGLGSLKNRTAMQTFFGQVGHSDSDCDRSCSNKDQSSLW